MSRRDVLGEVYTQGISLKRDRQDFLLERGQYFILKHNDEPLPVLTFGTVATYYQVASGEDFCGGVYIPTSLAGEPLTLQLRSFPKKVRALENSLFQILDRNQLTENNEPPGFRVTLEAAKDKDHILSENRAFLLRRAGIPERLA